MKTRLFYLLFPVLLLITTVVALGQGLSVKSSSGNGPVLRGLKITDAKAVGNIKALGTMTRTPTTGSDEADVRFSLSGSITQYRYNGKTYKAKYPDCRVFCGDCSQKKVKVTATIKYGNKTITKSGEVITLTGLHHFIVRFPGTVKRNTVSLVKLVVEPVAYPRFEAQLAKLKDCKEKQEEKKKKESEKKETTQTDDDFWGGGKEETKTRKVVLNTSNDDFWDGGSEDKTASNKKVSDKDFWSGENEKSDADKQTQSAFRIINEYSQYNRNNDGKYSWVEDADGNIIIPKGKYRISSFKDGLAKIEKIIRTDYYDFVRDKKVQLFETCFMDENGNKLPPKTYSLSYGHYYNPFTLYSSSMTRAEIDESKRRNKAKDKNAYQQLKSIYSSQGFDID
jgi:hypothetical protein